MCYNDSKSLLEGIVLGESTKERILKTAISLFNEKGFEAVSMRDIADALDISPGNLTYHYKKKLDILDEIIYQLRNEHEEMKYHAEMSLAEFHQKLSQIALQQKKYVFFYRNIVELRNNYTNVDLLQDDYKKEFLNLLRSTFVHFQSCGLMKLDYFKNNYADLAYAVLTIATFGTQIDYNYDLKKAIWAVLLPNLTDEGRAQYRNLEIYPDSIMNSEFEEV